MRQTARPATLRRLLVEFVFVALRAPGTEWYLLRRNMAESDGKPASSPLSTEEADRLSEKFKPSWEAEPQPRILPKVEPTVKMSRPSRSSRPEDRADRQRRADGENRADHQGRADREDRADRQRRAERENRADDRRGKPKPQLGKQTLLGVAVPLPLAPWEGATRGSAPDDLHGELPTNPVPSPPQQAQPIEPPQQAQPIEPPQQAQPIEPPQQAQPIEPPQQAQPIEPPQQAQPIEPPQQAQPIEPPPKSSPSGMGEKYVPKEAGAPPIVLTDEVKRAEANARAQLAAEHRARSAPTLLKLKAVDLQPKTASSDDEADFAPPRKRLGIWIGLGVGVCAAIIGLWPSCAVETPRRRSHRRSQ